MFKLDHKSIIIGTSALATSIVLLAGCNGDSTSTGVSAAAGAPCEVGVYAIKNKTAIDGGVTYARKNGVYGPYRYNEQSTAGINYGRTPTANEIAVWDIDALPDGTGLPEGQGSVEEGDELYDAQCASCHGEFGAGGKGYPALTGGNMDKDENGVIKVLKNQRLLPGMDAPKRTVGTYWPKVTTLYTYIRDAMPYAHPKSLTDDEVYAITAYILANNGIEIDGEEMDDEYVLNKEKLTKVVLPNNNGFYPDIDNGPEPVRAFYADRAKNIGMGIRCMKDCTDVSKDGHGKMVAPSVAKIKYEMSDVVPPYSTVRDLPPEVENGLVSKEEKMYNTSCKLCHATDNMGAPAVGDADAWAEVMAKGLDKVVHNAINGTEGMPPKGGNMDLSDADVKSIVEFMVNSSKKSH